MAILKKIEEREIALVRVNENLDTLKLINNVLDVGAENMGIAGATFDKNGHRKEFTRFDLSPVCLRKLPGIFTQQQQFLVKQIETDVAKFDVELSNADLEIMKKASCASAKKKEAEEVSDDVEPEEKNYAEQEADSVAEEEVNVDNETENYTSSVSEPAEDEPVEEKVESTNQELHVGNETENHTPSAPEPPKRSISDFWNKL